MKTIQATKVVEQYILQRCEEFDAIHEDDAFLWWSPIYIELAITGIVWLIKYVSAYDLNHWAYKILKFEHQPTVVICRISRI